MLDSETEFRVKSVRVFDNFALVGNQVSVGVAASVNERVTLLKDPDGKLIEGDLYDAFSLTRGYATAFIGNQWYSVDLLNAVGTPFKSDWPLNEIGGPAIPTKTVVFQDPTPKVLTATSMFWTDVGGDSLGTLFDRYGFLQSLDSGLTWQMSNQGIGKNIYCWDIKNIRDTVYALSSYALSILTFTRGWVYRSIDRGQTWAECQPLPYGFENRMNLDIDDNGVVYVAGGGLVRSFDQGQTWNFIPGPWPDGESPRSSSVIRDHLYVATGSHLFVSNSRVTSVNVTRDSPSNGIAVLHGNQIHLPHSMPLDGVYLVDVLGREIPIEIENTDVINVKVMLNTGIYFLHTKENVFKVFSN